MFMNFERTVRPTFLDFYEEHLILLNQCFFIFSNDFQTNVWVGIKAGLSEKSSLILNNGIQTNIR